MNELAAKNKPEGTRDSPEIGLTYQEVVTTFNKGKPLACYSTKTSAGLHLQCWYPDHIGANGYRGPTMYFDNGQLTAVQSF